MITPARFDPSHTKHTNFLPLLSHYFQKKVLVTGGAGFIGSHITQALINGGAQVTVLDNLSTGNLTNLEPHLSSLTFINGDITDFTTCVNASKQQDLIIHCAAATSVPESTARPLFYHDTNVTGTSNILEAARINTIKAVIFSSSSAVYGPQDNLCHEELPPNPCSPYGYTKLLGELYCKQYSALYNLKTICLRYFNVYGPRQNPHGPYAGALAAFYHRISQNQPITIYGTGLQRRDFVPVEKIVYSNLLAGLASLVPTNSNYSHYTILNVASGLSVTINETFERVKKEFPNYTHVPTFAPARPGDVFITSADCTRYHAFCSQAAHLQKE